MTFFQIHLKASEIKETFPVQTLDNYVKQTLATNQVPCLIYGRWTSNLCIWTKTPPGLDIVLYKGHIIKTGSATQATLFGYFENCIQKVGR